MSDRGLWSVAAMAAAMRASPAGPLPAAVRGLSIDSRSIEPGEAFFAIRGENRDGHDFVAAALERGAALAVVAQEKRGAVPPGQFRFRIEQVHLAGAAVLKEQKNALGFGWEVGLLRQHVVVQRRATRRGFQKRTESVYWPWYD